MPAAPVAERLDAVRSEVKRACDLLIASSPDAVNGCQIVLQHAVEELSALSAICTTTKPATGTRPRAADLLAEIGRASHLLQNLADFYAGWERLLGTMTLGYTANGDAARVTRTGRLHYRG